MRARAAVRHAVTVVGYGSSARLRVRSSGRRLPQRHTSGATPEAAQVLTSGAAVVWIAWLRAGVAAFDGRDRWLRVGVVRHWSGARQRRARQPQSSGENGDPHENHRMFALLLST